MIFERVQAVLKSDDPKEIAKVLFDFFMWQYENAIRNEIAERCDYNAAVVANEAAAQAYKDENQLGWGPKLPYEAHVLKMKKDEATRALKNREDAKKLMDFLRDRFLEKLL